MGVLLSDGFDGALLAALEKAVTDEGGLLRFIAPRIGGVSCSNDNLHKVTDQLGGAPSVLFDAVAILPGVETLETSPAAIDFLKDAHVHCKHIGWTESASALFAASGLSGSCDDGIHALTDPGSADDFVKACRGLRYWGREAMIMA
jgi:catalase